MLRNILKINITNELDVVLAYKRAKQISERLGITIGNQTKFATAVSEICRNVIEHVGNGTIQFNLTEESSIKYIEAIVTDRGRGVGDVEQLFNRSVGASHAKGTGIIHSRKLVDYFDIESDFEKGTKVTLRQRLPHNAPPVTAAIAEAWMYEFDMDNVSPYAEIKRQNMQLLEVLEHLRERNEVAEKQLLEIQRLNEQLQESNNEVNQLLQERDRQNILLQESNAELDAFAHTVSHDLRAPLQNIRGINAALEDCLQTDKVQEAQTLFPMMHHQINRLDQFILSILSYSLAGSQNIVKTEVTLKELLEEVISQLGVPENVAIDLPSKPLKLVTESILLQQVFSNLISNAIKYHDLTNGATIVIDFEVRAEQLRFTVQDNGPGIPAEGKDAIFNMHQTLHSNMASNSTGLGLSIVKKIITGKQCKVWVESEGRGSRFIFTWPASEIQA